MSSKNKTPRHKSLLKRTDSDAVNLKTMIYELFARMHILIKKRSVLRKENRTYGKMLKTKFNVELNALRKDQAKRKNDYTELLNERLKSVDDNIGRLERSAKILVNSSNDYVALKAFWNANLARTAKGIVLVKAEPPVIPPRKEDLSEFKQLENFSEKIDSKVASADIDIDSFEGVSEDLAKQSGD